MSIGKLATKLINDQIEEMETTITYYEKVIRKHQSEIRLYENNIIGLKDKVKELKEELAK